ncbi:Lrp/AsnC family transcriptional regulator [Arthrobacter crystallopoietes]|uniref:Lrp/AsnC family transcriptional regulator n=1 Tax=Crystallibacter crystallopoietes TaxID=37928 RepID=UPI001ABDCB65|nr:Lrp/AsnC family transcriptional regulator [Arthrobacter crystallopoietes]QTG79571.1 Lrp/AsnC family transcriptional regulator [Arthrobacter crystallopoietes]
MGDLEERLVRHLQQDGRASFSELAKTLDTNRATVAAHVNALLESGEIRIVAAVHPRVLGLNCLAHIAVQLSGDPVPVLEAMEAMESPVFISQTTGPYHLAAELRMPTLASMYEQTELIRTLPQVASVNVTVYERVIRSFFLGAEPKLMDLELDEYDLRLMNLLQRDGRASFAEMAAEVGLSLSACRTRVLKLINANVMQIGAIRRRADTSQAMAFGFGLSTSGIEEAVRYLEDVPGAEFIVKCFGHYNLIATVGVASLGEFNRVAAGLRQLASVTTVDTWLHADIVRERYEKPLDTLVAGIPDAKLESIG